MSASAALALPSRAERFSAVLAAVRNLRAASTTRQRSLFDAVGVP